MALERQVRAKVLFVLQLQKKPQNVFQSSILRRIKDFR